MLQLLLSESSFCSSIKLKAGLPCFRLLLDRIFTHLPLVTDSFLLLLLFPYASRGIEGIVRAPSGWHGLRRWLHRWRERRPAPARPRRPSLPRRPAEGAGSRTLVAALSLPCISRSAASPVRPRALQPLPAGMSSGAASSTTPSRQAVLPRARLLPLSSLYAFCVLTLRRATLVDLLRLATADRLGRRGAPPSHPPSSPSSFSPAGAVLPTSFRTQPWRTS